VRLWATSLEQFRRQAGPDMYDGYNFTYRFYFDNSTTAEVQGRIIHAEAPDMAEQQFILLCPGKSLVQFGGPMVAPRGVHISCDTCDKGWIFEVRWDSTIPGFRCFLNQLLLTCPQLDGKDGLALMNGEQLPAREKLAVCYKPWYGPADDALPLVESLIFYSTMGATHFVFLNNRGITPRMVRRQARNTLSPRQSLSVTHCHSLARYRATPVSVLPLLCPSPSLSLTPTSLLCLVHPPRHCLSLSP
jgi:hypothetical protein